MPDRKASLQACIDGETSMVDGARPGAVPSSAEPTRKEKPPELARSPVTLTWQFAKEDKRSSSTSRAVKQRTRR